MDRLLKLLRPYKKEFLIGPFFKLLEAILELLLPTVMALVVNHGVLQKNTSYIYKMGFVMISMSLLGFGCSLICQYLAAKASQGYGTDVRRALFGHISSFSFTELDRFGASTLTTRLTNDVNQLQLAVAMFIRLAVRAPFICIGAIIMAMILNFRLSLILIGAAPFFIGVLYLIISKSSPLYKCVQQKLDTLSSMIRENLGGIRVIRAFSRESFEKEKFEHANNDLTLASNQVAKLSNLLSPMTSLIMNMTIVAVLWVGGLDIHAGRFTQGEMIAYINYITQMLLALIVVTNLIILFTKAYTSAGRVSEILNTTPSIQDFAGDTKNKTTVTPTDPFIVFQDISFSYYHTEEKALEHIDLVINHGETIGIIGATGSGKTTLVNLIGRFYEAESGIIKINGINIKEYPLSALRKLMGYIPQKSLLISGTIADNLRLGNEGASDEMLKRAAIAAQADDFITRLPDGYQTNVSRGGQNFSGGQKQRMAIARALAAKPALLILDDSASALDFATEARLRKALREYPSSMTVLMISQRASTIRHCDKIYVMDDGKIAGIGTHNDLIKTCPLYLDICLTQMSAEELQNKEGVL